MIMINPDDNKHHHDHHHHHRHHHHHHRHHHHQQQCEANIRKSFIGWRHSQWRISIGIGFPSSQAIVAQRWK